MNVGFLLRRAGLALFAALALTLPCRAQFVIPGPDLRLNGFVFAVESDSAGNVYLGGSFNEFNGDSSSGLGLLRLTSGGVKNTIWDIGFIDGVSDLLVKDNFLYVAGSFTSVRTLSAGTISRSRLLRIFLTGVNEGKVDPAWVPNPNGAVKAIETDGTDLFIGGSFGTVNGTTRPRLAKILISGADPDLLDASWNPAPDNEISDLEYSASRLYVSGDFANIGGLANNYLARLSPGGSGTADSLWHPNINRPVGELESTAAHLYFGGDFTQVEGATHRSLGRYSTAAGAVSFDSGWKPDPDGEVSAMAISGSSLYIAGVFTKVSASARRFMAKVDIGGAGGLDPSFLPEPNGAIQDLKVIGSGLLAGGRFNTTSGSASAGYAVMGTSTGAALSTFAGTLTTEGAVYAMQPVSGGMIIGGLFDSVNGVSRTSIAKINSNGSLDTSFNAPLVGFNRLVSDFKLDGSTLYLCGDFLTVGGAPTQHVARINATTGAVDAGWFTKPLTPILCIETDGSFVYIGSAGLRFIQTSESVGTQVFNVARLSKSGPAAVDVSWTPAVTLGGNPATASVVDMQINGSNLIVAGKMTFIANPSVPADSYQRVGIASLSTSGWGQPAAGWGTLFQDQNSNVATINNLLLHNGSLYVAGDFVFVNGEEIYYVAKLNATTGARDTAFDVSPIDSSDPFSPGKVRTLAGSGNHVYIGGAFDQVFTGTSADGFEPSPYIVRVSQTTGLWDPSWYPFPNDSVSKFAFAGDNLWISGSFDMVGDTPVDGPAIVTPFSSSYQTWLNTYFLPGEITNPDLTAPFWDLDGDGDSNLVEAMFNTDPFSSKKTYQAAGSGSSGLPLIRAETVAGQNYLTIEFTRWKAAANFGAVATPQFGDNLSTWPRTGTILSTTSIDANRERVKYRDSTPNLPKAFGRVNVSPQTP